jgi:hypothetical protein
MIPLLYLSLLASEDEDRWAIQDPLSLELYKKNFKNFSVVTFRINPSQWHKLSIDPWNMFCTNLNNHVPLMIPVNYCTSIDSSQKYLVYSIETHIKS